MMDQPSGVTREYEIRVNSLITQAHGILAIDETDQMVLIAYPAFPLSFSKSLPSDSSADSIRELVKSCRCNNDGRGFSEVDGQPTPVALMGDPRPVRHGSDICRRWMAVTVVKNPGDMVRMRVRERRNEAVKCWRYL